MQILINLPGKINAYKISFYCLDVLIIYCVVIYGMTTGRAAQWKGIKFNSTAKVIYTYHMEAKLKSAILVGVMNDLEGTLLSPKCLMMEQAIVTCKSSHKEVKENKENCFSISYKITFLM